jgi:hypothetical protein
MPYQPTGRPPGRPRKPLFKLTEQPDVPDRWMRMLAIELRPWLGGAKALLKEVAAAGACSCAMVSKLRANRRYTRARNWLVGQKIAEQLDAEDHE